MKKIFIITIVVSVLSFVYCGSSTGVNRADQPCTAGHTYQEDCNTCRCLPRGDGYACTKMICPVREKKEVKPEDQPCTAGHTYQNDCNTCRCGPRGDGYTCTKMLCPHRETRGVKPENQSCTKGHSYQNDCNTCWCVSRDVYTCTRMACPPREKREVKPEDQPCTAGHVYQNDCNTCRCGPRGDGYTCTKMLCPTREKRDNSLSLNSGTGTSGQRCVPDSNYKEDCNVCICSADGKSARCTLKACALRTTRDTTTGQVCEPGKTFKKDCNTCVCSSDGKSAGCTYKFCPRITKRDTANGNQVCEPGKSFKRECNTCRCSEDGRTAACTQKFCIHREKRAPLSPTGNHCEPSPCGPNSQCRIVSGHAVCSCFPTYIGSPPNCRPECEVNTECPKTRACINQKCVDPCPGTCGLNARCEVINHNPICSCMADHTGDPFTKCNPSTSTGVTNDGGRL